MEDYTKCVGEVIRAASHWPGLSRVARNRYRMLMPTAKCFAHRNVMTCTLWNSACSSAHPLLSRVTLPCHDDTPKLIDR